ncbi:MAG: FAD-dependent oxidoreductase [Planctomycetaceae bacterium]|nr:FAD-dependent oxidoreductase [Planctomycetaceae bacterium]
MSLRWIAVAVISCPLVAFAAEESTHDVVVYGGTSGGVTAAIQAKLMGKSVVLIEPGRHIGGLTSGGLGATDIGNKAAIGGLSRQFYRRIGQHYDNDAAWKQEKPDQSKSRRKASGEPEMWTFEPHVAEAVYLAWLKEHSITPILSERLDLQAGLRMVKIVELATGKEKRRIGSIVMESGRVFHGKMFIDATYEGDLMAKAGVPYHVGREANKTYGETLNGIEVAHSTKHQFTKDVDPYIKPGDPKSGLLPLVQAGGPGVDGDGDARVQTYNFRMCTTDVAENRRAWPKPPNYDEKTYELLLRNFEAGDHRSPWNPVWMPNRKTDTNNNFAISTDYIGANYAFPDADYATRDKIIADHRYYQLGLMYTLANHPRVPEKIREEFTRLGLARDEFVDNDNWPHQLYVREARRMISEYVMTQHHCQQKVIAEDPVGLGAYNMDSHNCQRYVNKDGFVRNEGDIQVGVSPYRISYRSLRPEQRHCENLLVPVCHAASHIAYGSIRMEPVFMVLGQSTATAACFAIDDNSSVQQVPYAKLRERLLADGQVLEWTGPVRKTADGIDPKTMTGIVVDNTDAKLQGDWSSSASIGGYVGADYLHDGDAGKGTKSATFIPTLPRPALYEIRVYYTPNPNRSDKVPVTITTASEKKTVSFNQKITPKVGKYAPLGTFNLPAGQRTMVTISNKDTTGYVVIDAVEFVAVTADEGTPALRK